MGNCAGRGSVSYVAISPALVPRDGGWPPAEEATRPPARRRVFRLIADDRRPP